MQPSFLVSGEDITKYIPQRQPMVMIDTLLQSTERFTATALQVEPDNIFVRNGYLLPPGIIENIAQTAAIRAGYFYITKDQPVPLGFIGGIKNLNIEQLPPVGSRIITKVYPVQEVFNISVIKGEVFQDEQVVAQCEMKIFVQQPTPPTK